MPSSYYTHASGKPANQTRGLASEVRYELDSIAASFALLPSPTALASGSINYALDTGLANAYVVSVSSAVTAYSDGFSFFFKPLNNNSGASTLNVNTLGLKAIVRPDGTAVQLNDIVANQILKLTYNSSYNGFQLDTDISYANQAAASASAAAASAGSAAASAAATAGAIVAERSASRALTNLTGITLASGDAQMANAAYVRGKDSGGTTTRMLGINAGNEAYVGSIDSGAVTTLNVNLAGTNRAVFSSTGLAVTSDSVDGNQLKITGATNQNYQIRVGFDTTNLLGKIQAIHVGTAYKDLVLQPEGGNLGIGRAANANYRAIIRGIGTTSATKTLVLENSSGTETVIVDDAGNLLVGATSGSSSEIRKNANTATAALIVKDTAATASNQYGIATYLTGDPNSSGNYFFSGVGNAAERVRICSNGNLLNTNNSYGAISDIKLKQDITDATPKLAKLLKVRIVNYKFKADPDGIKQIGVIAQELEEISPGLIEETPDFEEVTLTREVEKTVPVTVKKEVMTERVLLEVIDGVAVQKVIKEVATVDEAVVDEYPVFDGDGNPVMEVVTPATDAELDDKGNEVKAASPAVLRQKIHAVPRMETVAEKEEYTERRLTGTTTKSVKYSIFVPMLIKAMQEQQAQIEELKARVGA